MAVRIGESGPAGLTTRGRAKTRLGWWILGLLALGCGGQASKRGADGGHAGSTSVGGSVGRNATNGAGGSSSNETGGASNTETNTASWGGTGPGGTGGSSAGGNDGVADTGAIAGAAGAAETGSGVEDFCQRFGEAVCNDGVLAYCQSDLDSCQKAQVEFCEGLFVDAEFDATGADSCIEAVRAAYEDGDLTADELRTVRDLENECDPVAVRPNEDEPPCADCNGDLTAADPCTDTRQCGEAFYCGFEGRCADRGSLGDACSHDRLCQTDLYCVIVGESEGVCLGDVRLSRDEPLCDDLR